jgi:osmoprotectant transport system ATP-binding protein
MINRLIAPDSGQIFVNGQSVNMQQIESLRRNIGYVLQENGLFPHYTVAENIGIVPTLLKWDKKRMEERTRSLMEKLHLSVADHYHAYPQQLSGGQQQRVGLARALAADPPVLLMDEPFGALDPVTRASVRKEFRSLDEIHNKTVIMVTHDVQEAFELGTRICLMDQGAIQQTGTPAALLFNPANDFVSSFFHEQRFQLELNALRLTDIRPWLSDTVSADDRMLVLKGENSCWDALEQMTTLSAPVNIAFEDRLVRVDTSELMHAFTQYKQTVSGHGRSTRLS